MISQYAWFALTTLKMTQLSEQQSLTPHPPPPNSYSDEDAVNESGLQDIFGPTFFQERDTLTTPFQCVQWGQPHSLAHPFHMGCVGIYIWKCCILSEYGRREIEEVTCPLCLKEHHSNFPFQGIPASATPQFDSSLNSIQASTYSYHCLEFETETYLDPSSMLRKTRSSNQQHDSQMAFSLAGEYPSIRQAILPRISADSNSHQSL